LACFGEALLSKYGVYDNVYELRGNIGLFVRQCCSKTVLGAAYGKAWRVQGDVIQIDKNASYPSTYRDFEGIPMGTPRLIVKEKRFEELSCYYVAVNITSFKCKEEADPFPLIESVGIHYVNKVLFDFMRERYEITYKFLTGVTFDGGFNTKLSELSVKLYDMRLKAKSGGDSVVAQVIKRLMNSFYGKSVQKEKPVKAHIVKNNSLNYYLYFNQDFIYSYKAVDEFNHTVALIRPMLYSWMIPQFACNVLNYSKIKMLDLVYKCVNKGCEVFYINTDCLTMRRRDFDEINDELNLLGQELGKFSVEAESKLYIALGGYKNLHVLNDGSYRVRYGAARRRMLDDPLDFFESKCHIQQGAQGVK
jgi:hypothetical protein